MIAVTDRGNWLTASLDHRDGNLAGIKSVRLEPIRDALGEAMQARTTIVIAHRPATIALADRVVLIDEGRVVADGTHSDLLANNERYREVLAADLGEETAGVR